MLKTIENLSRVDVITYQPNFSAICSIGLSPFHGEIKIEYKPIDKLLEFESFEMWLRSIATTQLTIEDLCRLVFDELSAALGDILLRVTVHAETTVHAPVSATIERNKAV